ncbi:RAxF-45 family protein [Neobacillus drentensis]|uniref:RAxF-45 family protein n=1 Tax=Neobacillus drentensis TaxID=220684 RepID=UPI000ACC68C7|nr:RAxF-45 family protein [Neobacillus drentensis]
MNRSIFARLLWLEALNIYRAIFHGVVFKGGESALFSKQKNEYRTITHLFPHQK